MPDSNFIFEKGAAINIGNAEEHNYVFESGTPISDGDESTLTFISGRGLGGGQPTGYYAEMRLYDEAGNLLGETSLQTTQAIPIGDYITWHAITDYEDDAYADYLREVDGPTIETFQADSLDNYTVIDSDFASFMRVVDSPTSDGDYSLQMHADATSHRILSDNEVGMELGRTYRVDFQHEDRETTVYPLRTGVGAFRNQNGQGGLRVRINQDFGAEAFLGDAEASINIGQDINLDEWYTLEFGLYGSGGSTFFEDWEDGNADGWEFDPHPTYSSGWTLDSNGGRNNSWALEFTGNSQGFINQTAIPVPFHVEAYAYGMSYLNDLHLQVVENPDGSGRSWRTQYRGTDTDQTWYNLNGPGSGEARNNSSFDTVYTWTKIEMEVDREGRLVARYDNLNGNVDTIQTKCDPISTTGYVRLQSWDDCYFDNIRARRPIGLVDDTYKL